MANFNANANTEDGVFVFNVGDRVKNKMNGEKGVVTEIVHDVFFGDSLRVKLESQNKSLGINMVSPETQERYIGLLLPFGFWVKCRDAREKNKSDLDWTHEEIQMAKELSRKMLIQIFDEGGCIDFTGCHKGDTAVWANYYTNDNRPGMAGQFVARVKNDDVFNQWIGKCVCLCKATKTPIPSFILNKNKERK